MKLPLPNKKRLPVVLGLFVLVLGCVDISFQPNESADEVQKPQEAR
jgi:hypothetical protein